MTLLAIDVGNTRVKWGFQHEGEWLSLGALPKADTGQLFRIWSDQPPPAHIVGCNVAGADYQQEIEGAAAVWGMRIEWATSQPAQCGVTNRYEHPTRLGVDRWIEMIAAYHRVAPTGHACIVMSVGTAVTIDAVTAGGEFVGGAILPSPHVMAESLEQNTAALKRVPGKFTPLPRNTADAITTGVSIAVGGALMRMEAALSALGQTDIDVIVTGGGASELVPTLTRAVTLIPNLLLEGLIVVASERR